MNEARCPLCNAVVEFDDEFTNFEDQAIVLLPPPLMNASAAKAW